MKSKIIKLFKLSIVVTFLFLAIVILINSYVILSTKKYVIRDINELPLSDTVLVLGAQVAGDNLSLVLKDRVEAGVEIFNADKSKKILLTGDHGQEDYDEVNAMRKYILKNHSVKEEDIFMDHAGFDTYDSMYRAKEIFDVKDVIIVTQDFHINRAVFIARNMGLNAVGYATSEKKYIAPLRAQWNIRELLARVKAFGDVAINAKPKYLGDKIPISGDGRLTLDQ